MPGYFFILTNKAINIIITNKKNITESTSYRPDAEEGERSLKDRDKSKDGEQD